jgi:hypothetical protein
MLLIHTLQDEGGICAAVKTAQIATDGREENMEGERARWGEVYCVPVMPRRPHLCTVSQKAAYDLRIAPLLAPQARIGRCMCHRVMLVQAVLGQCHTYSFQSDHGETAPFPGFECCRSLGHVEICGRLRLRSASKARPK